MKLLDKYTDGLRNNNIRYKSATIALGVMTAWLAIFADYCPNMLRIISGCLAAVSVSALVIFRKR